MQLPWPQYEAVLRIHLARLPRLLDYQKQLVRTVIAVLDAFHFDLSVIDSTGEEQAKETPVKVSQHSL